MNESDEDGRRCKGLVVLLYALKVLRTLALTRTGHTANRSPDRSLR